MFGTQLIIPKKLPFTTLREKLKELKEKMEKLKFLSLITMEIMYQLTH